MNKSILALLLISGCASPGIDRANQNEITKEFYASVMSIKPVKLSSNVKTGVIGGAVIGVTDEIDGDHEDMIAGGLAGALVDGLFIAVLEGSDDAYEFTLHSSQEGNFTLVQKELIDITSGCVKISVNRKATIHPTTKENCKA